MSIRIPTNWVKRKSLDYDMESMNLLGRDLDCGGFLVSPLTAGTLITLELTTNRWFKDPTASTWIDTAKAILIVNDGITSRHISDKAYTVIAEKFLDKHSTDIYEHISDITKWLREVPFYGFEMRNTVGGEAQKPFIFDGSFFGSVVCGASRIMSTPVAGIMWHTSLCAVGHAIAQYEASVTGKSVERPPDLADLDRLMQEAEERENRGELHPWQRLNPIAYPLSEDQVRKNPALIEEYNALLKEVNHG